MEIGRILIILGVMFLVMGILSQMQGGFSLGNLPGDLKFEKENYSIHIPIVSSIMISILISVLFWLMTK
jgi:ribose/xylose/arabinose/galactoside ABC-type transport system permease subunit